MNKLQALDAFWHQFGWDAYDETSVPDTATLPYITYEGSSDNFDHPIAQVVNLYDRSTSWKTIAEMLNDIEHRIGRGGAIVKYDGGAMWIKRGTPWAQRMADESNDTVRRVVLNIETEYID